MLTNLGNNADIYTDIFSLSVFTRSVLSTPASAGFAIPRVVAYTNTRSLPDCRELHMAY